MKGEQSFRNDEIVWFIERWFKDHQVMSLENYQMLKEMVHYTRER